MPNEFPDQTDATRNGSGMLHVGLKTLDCELVVQDWSSFVKARADFSFQLF